MANRHVKLSINGINYKVTGIDETKSYKDILCTIAKQNETLESKESPIKHKTLQKQKNSEEKKTMSPRSEGNVELRVKDPSEKDRLKDIKLIHVEKNVESEKGLMRRKAKKSQTDENKNIRRAKDDSDIEVYHKSRKRMKNIMKRKCKDESDQSIYDKHVINGVSMKKEKRKVQRNQIPHSFMDGCDKISIYYLDEDSGKQKERAKSISKSNSGSSIGGPRSKASSPCNSIKKRPSLKLRNIESKYGDDKDSGIPSWESEEISSKDDNKIEEKISEEPFEHFKGPDNEILNDSKICPDLHKTRSKDCVLQKTNFEQMGKFDMPMIGDSVGCITDMEEQKPEREIVPINNDLLENCFFAEIDKRSENLPVNVEKKKEDEEIESEYEIIRTENAESSEPKNERHLCKDDDFSLAEEKRNDSEAQHKKMFYDLNSNLIYDAESTHGNEAKFNLENRGSFILVEFDDIQLKCIDKYSKIDAEREQVLPEDFNSKKETSKANIKPLLLQKRKECLNSSIILDKGSCHEIEDTNLTVDGKADSKEYLTWQEKNVGSPNDEEGDDKTGCQKGEQQGDIQKATNEKNIKHSSISTQDQLTIEGSGLKPIENCNIAKEKEKLENGSMLDCNVEQASLTEQSSKINYRNSDTEFTDAVSKSSYGKARNFSQKGDKLITKLISKFAKQIEHDLKVKFCKHKKDRLFEGKKAGDNAIMSESNYKGSELWKKYVEVCEQIYNLSQNILFLDLKAVQRKFELEQIKERESWEKDEALDDDENNIVNEIIEFRQYLKKVTLASRKNRTELKENQIQIDKIDLALASKRSFLRSFEQNIPRTLLRCYNRKHRR